MFSKTHSSFLKWICWSVQSLLWFTVLSWIFSCLCFSSSGPDQSWLPGRVSGPSPCPSSARYLGRSPDTTPAPPPPSPWFLPRAHTAEPRPSLPSSPCSSRTLTGERTQVRDGERTYKLTWLQPYPSRCAAGLADVIRSGKASDLLERAHLFMNGDLSPRV